MSGTVRLTFCSLVPDSLTTLDGRESGDKTTPYLTDADNACYKF